MKTYIIRHALTHATLYENQAHDFKSCLEQAIANKVDVTGADFRFQDLSNANLDGASLNFCDFRDSNLSGANLSECHLRHVNFSGATLCNTCMAYSYLSKVCFDGAAFGATDIAYSSMIDCYFSTLSCFSLNFFLCEKIERCRFKMPRVSSFTSPKPLWY